MWKYGEKQRVNKGGIIGKSGEGRGGKNGGIRNKGEIMGGVKVK